MGEVKGSQMMLTEEVIGEGVLEEETAMGAAELVGRAEEAGSAASRWRNLQIGRGVRLFVVQGAA